MKLEIFFGGDRAKKLCKSTRSLGRVRAKSSKHSSPLDFLKHRTVNYLNLIILGNIKMSKRLRQRIPIHDHKKTSTTERETFSAGFFLFTFRRNGQVWVMILCLISFHEMAKET